MGEHAGFSIRPPDGHLLRAGQIEFRQKSWPGIETLGTRKRPDRNGIGSKASSSGHDRSWQHLTTSVNIIIESSYREPHHTIEGSYVPYKKTARLLSRFLMVVLVAYHKSSRLRHLGATERRGEAPCAT